MPDRVERVLYLDSDYFLTLGNPALEGIQLEVTVEVPPDVDIARHARYMSEGITILADRPLVNGGRMSVYEPTMLLLDIVSTETASGRYDWVIIGNNRGAGVTKARRVAVAMKDKTIIIANGYPPEGLYRDLGFQHFASREIAGNLLARLIAETRLVPSMVDIDDERCCSCGDELHNGECTNYFCPMRDRY